MPNELLSEFQHKFVGIAKNLTAVPGISESSKTVSGKNEHKMIIHCSL